MKNKTFNLTPPPECGSRCCLIRLGETQHQKAFTLAEILITLSIIGVIAALTIPSLIAKNQEKETVVRLKKTYNLLSDAFNIANTEYGDPTNWGIGERSGTNISDIMVNYLNVIKYCKGGVGCFPDVTYKKLDGTLDRNLNRSPWGGKMILADGSCLEFYGANKDCLAFYGESFKAKNTCAVAAIDINGFKSPNQGGIDFFAFYITKYGILPYGSPELTIRSGIYSCNAEGWSCTAWVLLKENMDYIKKPVNWD